jgi:hypothetical protein
VAGAPPPPPPAATTAKRSKGPLVLLGLVAIAVVVGAIAFAMSDDDDATDASGPVAQIDEDGTTTTEPDADDGDEPADDRTDDKAAVEQTGAPDPTDPQIYGDDAALDKLYDACKRGDMPSCDRLYRDSGFGTTYEAFGDTCGNRNRSQGYCTDLYPSSGGSSGGTAPAVRVSDGLADTSANGYGDDPDLDRFWNDCQAGAMTACDSLYLSAPAGTDYELYGATCGGRNDVQGYCTELYG